MPSFEDISRLFGAVIASKASSVVTFIAVLLAVCTVALVYRAVKAKPAELKTWDTALLFAALIATVVTAILGPAIGLLELANQSSISAFVEPTGNSPNAICGICSMTYPSAPDVRTATPLAPAGGFNIQTFGGGPDGGTVL
jgi:cytochrome bd-type quinol oxidase subunit 2